MKVALQLPIESVEQSLQENYKLENPVEVFAAEHDALSNALIIYIEIEDSDYEKLPRDKYWRWDYIYAEELIGVDH